MSSQNFVIASMLTFGRKPRPLRIVELTLSKFFENERVVILTTTIDPEERIPNYLNQKTRLTDEQLLKAPTFSEIADLLLNHLDNSILVGHNASFIHYALQSEFRFLGYALKMPQLCTFRLAKKLMPNMTAYELPYLCSVLNIPYMETSTSKEINEAISTLFQRLLDLDEEWKVINAMLNPEPKARRELPQQIKSSQFDKLPNKPGIYRFQDVQGVTIYVGKAKDIKNRVLSHFYNNSEKELRLCEATYTIDHEPTGSELVALLREADLIQKRDPYFNYIQKKRHITYYIVAQRNRKGILQQKIERRPFEHIPTEIFLKRGYALARLKELTDKFELCPKFTGLQSGKSGCDHLDFQYCNGVCRGLEAVGTYSERVEQAINYLNQETEHFVIFEKGRNRNERSFVLVLHGVYQGYGFLDDSHSITSIQGLLDLMVPEKHSYHTAKIIMGFKIRNPEKLKYFKSVDR